jgi:apolipoprotein N-acyltransferase
VIVDLLERAPWPALLAAAGLTGAATFLSTAGQDVAVLAWVAPVPLLAFAFARWPQDAAAARGRNVRLAAAAFAGSFAGQLSWAALYRGILPVVPLLAFAAAFGAAFALATWLTAFVARRLGSWAGVLVFPAAWVAFEFGVGQVSPHGSAGSLAYSQAGVIPLIQVAAWTGLAGITFLVQLFAAGLAAAVGGIGAEGVRWRLVAAPALVVVAALGAGQWRVQTMTARTQALVGLVSIDRAMERFDATDRDLALGIAGRYVEGAHALAVRGVDAVVMPEKMIGVAPAYEDEVTSLISSPTEQAHVIVVAGLNLVGREPRRNVAALFSGGGRALLYDKRHMVPGLEAAYAAGSGPGLHKAPGGMTGVAICKDMDFPALGREYGRAGVGLLFVPAWDFTRDARLHSRMAVMRGVEGGFSVARAAANGLLTGSDCLGRVIGEEASDAASRSTLVVSLPIGAGRTFYSEHGDWLGWASAAAALVVLVAALV